MKTSFYRSLGIALAIILSSGLTLPFHYVPSAMKVIRKTNFLKQHNYNKGQIDEYLGRYND